MVKIFLSSFVWSMWSYVSEACGIGSEHRKPLFNFLATFTVMMVRSYRHASLESHSSSSQVRESIGVWPSKQSSSRDNSCSKASEWLWIVCPIANGWFPCKLICMLRAPGGGNPCIGATLSWGDVNIVGDHDSWTRFDARGEEIASACEIGGVIMVQGICSAETGDGLSWKYSSSSFGSTNNCRISLVSTSDSVFSCFSGVDAGVVSMEDMVVVVVFVALDRELDGFHTNPRDWSRASRDGLSFPFRLHWRWVLTHQPSSPSLKGTLAWPCSLVHSHRRLNLSSQSASAVLQVKLRLSRASIFSLDNFPRFRNCRCFETHVPSSPWAIGTAQWPWIRFHSLSRRNRSSHMAVTVFQTKLMEFRACSRVGSSSVETDNAIRQITEGLSELAAVVTSRTGICDVC